MLIGVAKAVTTAAQATVRNASRRFMFGVGDQFGKPCNRLGSTYGGCPQVGGPALGTALQRIGPAAPVLHAPDLRCEATYSTGQKPSLAAAVGFAKMT